MANPFDELIRKLSVNFKTDKQKLPKLKCKEKKLRKKYKNCGSISKCLTICYWNTRRQRKKNSGALEVFEKIIGKNFSKINGKHQTTKQEGSSENTKQNK